MHLLVTTSWLERPVFIDEGQRTLFFRTSFELELTPIAQIVADSGLTEATLRDLLLGDANHWPRFKFSKDVKRPEVLTMDHGPSSWQLWPARITDWRILKYVPTTLTAIFTDGSEWIKIELVED